jgi:hypothetical protein
MDTKKDKADLRAAQTKSAYFDNNILEAMRDENSVAFSTSPLRLLRKIQSCFSVKH